VAFAQAAFRWKKRPMRPAKSATAFALFLTASRYKQFHAPVLIILHQTYQMMKI
jgi:uncharacterized membrane protein YgdD (TMEM256/DUF423 family)